MWLTIFFSVFYIAVSDLLLYHAQLHLSVAYETYFKENIISIAGINRGSRHINSSNTHRINYTDDPSESSAQRHP